MKVNICDICLAEDEKQVIGNWRLSIKDGKGRRLALDSCDKHKDWMKQFKTYAEAEQGWVDLISKKRKRLEGEVANA